MIRLFDKDETNFDSNGLGVLDSEIKENVVEEKMNGIYNFDFAYLSKGEHASQLEGDMIIKAPTPDSDQLFRVYKVTKNIGFLEVNCYHIFYDLAGNFIEDINIVSQSGQAAITHFGTGLQYATRFKFVSNIVGTNSARMVRLNAVQALLDSSQDNSFLSRWGGEIKRDNFTVYMNDVRGNDKGFKIRHGKNLTGYEANIDYSTVVTRIMPYGYNGLMLPEKYVDSPLRNKYAFTRIKKIEYTNIKAIDPDATSNDESAVPLKEAYELLRQAAALEYSVNKVDIPTSNFKVTFNNLADTKEYADFKALEKVEPWDYVTVIADNLNIKSRMISYKYDAITKSYKEVELGNYVPSFTDIGSKIDHATNLANQANGTANTAAESANGKNSNYYGPSEPSRPVDGDLWYKKNGDKTELWQYDGKSVPPGWKLVVDDVTGEEVRQNVDKASKEAEEAKKQANKALDGANDAVAKAGFANDTATQAKSDAAAAGQQAKNALTSAGTAITDAQNALTNSSSAQADSAQARKDSATAKIQATNAATQANQAVTDASTAKADAAAAKGQATNALGQAGTAIGNALTALNKVNDMSVGGRNYFLNSNQYLTGARKQQSHVADILGDTLQKLRGKQVTISVDVDYTNARHEVGQKCRIGHEFAVTYESGYKQYLGVWKQTTAGESFSGRISQTMMFNDEPIISTSTQIWAYAQDAFDSSSVGRPKLEIGNVATDWTPAPEDVQQQFTDINGELSQKVSQTTYNVLAGTVDTVSTLAKQNQSTISNLATKTSVDTVNKTATTAQTLAQQNANELLNKASTNTVNTLTQRVTTAESTLSQTATKAELALTKTDVDKLNDTVKSQGVTLDATATKAELQVAQTNVDNLKKTVTSNSAGVTANANALKLKADSSTVSDLDGRVTSLSGQLDVQSDLISAKVTASDVTGMLNGYATQSWSQGQISAAKNEISASVETVKNTVDNLQIDGRNYFSVSGFTANKYSGNYSIDYYDIQLLPDTKYTVSTNHNRDDGMADVFVGDKGFTASSLSNGVTPGKPRTVTTDSTGVLTIAVRNYSLADGKDEIQIELGTVATSWQPDPEDMATVDWAKAQLKVNDDKITAGITTVTNTLNNNIATATANMATTTWTNTQIDAAKTAINLSVEQSITTSENTLNSNIANATADMATKTWTQGQIKTTADNINLSVSKVKTDLGGAKTQFAELEVKVNGIQTTVSGKADKSQITQLSGQITSVVGDVSANSSQITQMKADINLRVKAGDVVNQINISPESILIAGQKVHITGQTHIDNAVIKDAMIANVKADKITAGTLNAANVNVINLNANNITTGTLKGTNLSMNLNTGEVLFQKGSIKSSDGTFAVDIDNRTITSTDNSHNGIVLKHGELLFYKGINAGSGSAEFGRMDVAFLNGGGLNITGYNGLTLGTEITGLYEANLALVSPKNSTSGKSIASLVGDAIYLQPSPGNLNGEINISGKTEIAGSVSVVGDFGVMGKKNAIHPTNDGIRETPAYETAESYLGDIGEGVTDESSRALIHIDDLFNQIINTDYDYQVFISSYSDTTIWVEKREKTSFEVHSNIPNAKFAFEIKAKRRGYETDRLVKSEMNYEQLNKFHKKKVIA